MADEKRFDEASLGVNGHQNIDGLATIASHRLEIYGLKYIAFVLWFGVGQFRVFGEQGIQRHARLHFSHDESISKNLGNVFFE